MSTGPTLQEGLDEYFTLAAWNNAMNNGSLLNRTVGKNEYALPGGYQPIPIHTDRIDREFLLRHFDESVCPNIIDEYTKEEQDFNVLDLMAIYSKLQKYFVGLKDKTQKKNGRLWEIWKISDNIRCLEVEGKAPQDFLADINLQEDLEFINTYALQYIFFNNRNKDWLMSPIVNEIFT